MSKLILTMMVDWIVFLDTFGHEIQIFKKNNKYGFVFVSLV